MSTNPSYVVVIPAYNEQSSIIDCLDHIYKASMETDNYRLKKIIICINGCTDDTELLIRGWSRLPIAIIRSKPGYVNAINKLFSFTRTNYPNDILIKTDADSQIAPNSLKILFNQLELHEDLLVVGAHPVPLKSTRKNPYRRLLSSIMSVRSRNPEAEVTITDTTKFHHYAAIDPIPELKGREEKMKIYFHGRTWCARRSKILPLLPSSVIGDDIYLAGWLIKNYGLRAMRLDYRAKVYYRPNDSLIRHWKVYRRIYEDRNIVFNIRGFEAHTEACPLKLDWGYIFTSCPFKEILYFIAYSALVNFEKVTYMLFKYNPAYWKYEKKET